jgi:hypothetical protein
MKSDMKVRPVDNRASKAIILSLAIIAIAVGASIFAFTYLLSAYELEPMVYGMIVIWIGSIVFFYAVITEEHTMKELFLRQSYFFTGIMSMILGMFLVSVAGLSIPGDISLLEFGLLILLLGAGLVLFSAQRTYDYSTRNGLFALFAGIFMILGGIMAGSLNISYAGVFVVMIAAIWLGLRDRYAQ